MQTVTAKKFMQFIDSLNLEEVSITQHITDEKRVITTRKGRKTIARNVLTKNKYGDWISLSQIAEAA